MTITHEHMMALTANMPMKCIEINGEPYLERYFAHMLADGTQVWYHRFLRNDSERHLHSHPWSAKSQILTGAYTEQREKHGDVVFVDRVVGEENYIFEATVHRIVKVEPNTWTQMIVRPERKSTWHFVDENGKRTEMPTSPFEWHKDFQPRVAA